MFIQVMSSLAVAAALTTATPALEHGDADAGTRRQRCACAATQAREHDGRDGATENRKASAHPSAETGGRRVDQLPLGWDPSWGG